MTFFDRGSKTQEDLRVIRFNKLIHDKSKKEIREIEKQLLVPIPIPTYTGPTPKTSSFKLRSIKFVFRTIADVELVKRHLHVASYIENNTTDVDMLVHLLRGIDNGTYTWNKDTKELTINEKRRNHRRVKIVRKAKQRTKIKRL